MDPKPHLPGSFSPPASLNRKSSEGFDRINSHFSCRFSQQRPIAHWKAISDSWLATDMPAPTKPSTVFHAQYKHRLCLLNNILSIFPWSPWRFQAENRRVLFSHHHSPAPDRRGLKAHNNSVCLFPSCPWTWRRNDHAGSAAVSLLALGFCVKCGNHKSARQKITPYFHFLPFPSISALWQVIWENQFFIHHFSTKLIICVLKFYNKHLHGYMYI